MTDSPAPTLQSLFETAARGCFAQGKQSVQGYFCAYRGEAGCKCAIGHCIPDELYQTDMEGKGMHSLLVSFPSLHVPFGLPKLRPSERAPALYDERAPALYDLQAVHDNVEHWKSEQTLRQAFRAYGKQYALSTHFLSTLRFPKEPQQ